MSCKIAQFELTNIKGIQNKTFEFLLHPNKPIIFVAPNGFGKSSFAAGFSSLLKTKLKIEDKNFYEGKESNTPSLSATIIDSQNKRSTLTANEKKNELSNHFTVKVINCSLKAEGKKRKISGTTVVQAAIKIPPVTLINTIPLNVAIPYHYSSLVSTYGAGKKVFRSLATILSKKKILQKLNVRKAEWTKPLGVRRTALLTTHKDFLKQNHNTKTNIIDTGENEWSHVLNSIPQLQAIVEILQQSSITHDTQYEYYLDAIQILTCYEDNKVNFKKALEYSHYQLKKDYCDTLVKQFNHGWGNVTLNEENHSNGKSLVVNFPKIESLSNGQRDSLVFIAKILQMEMTNQKENVLLIIDEVFDYLDDVNLISVQYFITKLIQHFKDKNSQIFPIILTHLDPYHFKTYAFKKPTICYLNQTTRQVNADLKSLLTNRNDETIKDTVSKHLLHYHTDTFSIVEEFRKLSIKPEWGTGDEFDKYIEKQTGKYLKGKNYDPFAICCKVRKHIEKLVWQALPTAELKQEFLDTHKTKNKLKFADENSSINIPEVHFLLGLVYNSALHWNDKIDMISPVVSKLDNIAIKNMIQEVLNTNQLPT